MKISMGYLFVSMSASKKDPAMVLREARNRSVAVHHHNRLVFYAVEPALRGRARATRSHDGRVGRSGHLRQCRRPSGRQIPRG
jgi:hypothetical protein